MGEQNEEFSPYERSASETASLELFHEGQAAALASDIETAQSTIEQCLVEARKSSDTTWIAYIEGTLAYLRGDRAALATHIPHAGDNAAILSKLAHGLEKRGSVNYREDYLE